LTAPEIASAKDRWLRATGYGLLAEIATIITIIAIVLFYRYVFARGLTDAQYDAFGQQTGAIIGVIGGTLYVYLFAHLLMRRLSTRFAAHGVGVAIAAIVLSIGGSLLGHHGVPRAYVIASLLKLIAGGLAGSIASRRATVMA
jgi:hypothetical protein